MSEKDVRVVETYFTDKEHPRWVPVQFVVLEAALTAESFAKLGGFGRDATLAGGSVASGVRGEERKLKKVYLEVILDPGQKLSPPGGKEVCRQTLLVENRGKQAEDEFVHMVPNELSVHR